MVITLPRVIYGIATALFALFLYSLASFASPPAADLIIVTTTEDTVADDGFCSLREAITAANLDEPSGNKPGECTQGVQHDEVYVPAGRYRLTCVGVNEDHNSTGDLDINLDTVTIRGEGAAATIIDGNGTDRIFQSISSNSVIFEDMTLTNGQAPAATEGTPDGGAIYFWGTQLTLRRVAVRGNHAGDGSDTAAGGNGGGLYIEARSAPTSFRIEQSEISDNHSGNRDSSETAPAAGNGGGIYGPGGGTDPTSVIINSTISGNTAGEGGLGGGLYHDYAPLEIIGSTIAENRIDAGMSGEGGGIYTVYHTVTLKGTLLANNHAGVGPDCRGIVQSALGVLISDVTDCDFISDWQDQINVDPHLEPLAANGGGTRTHAILEGSPAIDHGECDGTMDQRGFPRPIDFPHIPNGSTACDSGGYELQTLSSTPTITLTPTPTQTLTPTPTQTATPVPVPPGDIYVTSTLDAVADDGQCTLREAITVANLDTPSGMMARECAAGNGADIIIVPTGIYELSAIGSKEDSNLTGDLDVASDITLYGEGTSSTIIDGYDADRIFHMLTGTVTIENVTLRHGHAPNGEPPNGASPGTAGEPGGAIRKEGGTLTLRHVVITENNAGQGGDGGNGGGQDSSTGTAGGEGGAIVANGGSTYIYDSEISFNHAGNGGDGGINNNDKFPGGNGGSGGAGGGFSGGDTITIQNSSIHHNLGGDGGASRGGIYHWGSSGAGGFYNAGTLRLVDSSVYNNIAGETSGYFDAWVGASGGIHTAGNATIINSTISGNVSSAGIGVYAGGVTSLGGDVRFIGSTVYANSGGDVNTGYGNMYFGNTIIGNCGSILISQGYNLLQNHGYCAIEGDETGNLYDIDPRLMPLGNYLGDTPTHAFYSDSPARDAGNCFDLTTDQRGYPRPSDLPDAPNASDGCDMGAYEEQAPPLTATPTVTPTPTSTQSPQITQRLYLPLVQR